ncbi:MAG: nucleotidyltransferase [Desulfurococcales archaeon]|nr:nucleotidyltransferase [Desulfurococcales archaeon]
MVTKKGFARTIRILLDNGFRFTLIGGTIVELELKSKDLGTDIDLFAEEPGVLLGEQEYYEFAESQGWVVGQTWLGTPRLIARIDQEEVPVEFYDNIYDFYVPDDMLKKAKKIKVEGVSIKAISLEDHIVLKANSGRGSDIERLKEIGRLIKKKKLKIDPQKIYESASLFDDEKVILRRIIDSGIPLK